MERSGIGTQPSRILTPDKINDYFVYSLRSLSKCSQISELTEIRNANRIWPGSVLMTGPSQDVDRIRSFPGDDTGTIPTNNR
jgi:hypothetical protein